MYKTFCEKPEQKSISQHKLFEALFELYIKAKTHLAHGHTKTKLNDIKKIISFSFKYPKHILKAKRFQYQIGQYLKQPQYASRRLYTQFAYAAEIKHTQTQI